MTRGLVGVALAGALLCVATGCNAGGSTKLGAGEPVDMCDGVAAMNELPAPELTDRQAILDFAAGALRVIDRIDTDRSVHTVSDTKIAVPDSVVSALKAEKASYSALRTHVGAATTAAKLHSVVQGFANSATFATADSTVELWAGNECG